ncbi:hypothetical protein UFOVP59_26 [uncultured Caudovirales phage]|uniref:Uncharacterized protein n=1 Tax=uncultured Caudovirales phage TaxID=2100421 RepID=A0A6J5KRN1_9CAUD|nr:hypothetical protein UFOVP59_26 [uncultured Caudovirales phage]CAB5220561.1 hypothetical protein UFOVP246_6 [uncultured Caudovirales phage]
MHQTFKGFVYGVAGKLATFKVKVKQFFTYDSIVLSQEQMTTIGGVCGKTKNVKYLSIIQDTHSKTISLCVQGTTTDGRTFITDNIPIDVGGNILLTDNQQ